MGELDRRLRVLTGVWLAAWLAVAVEVVVLTGLWVPLYRDLGVALPVITEALLEVADALRSGWGLLPLALVLGLGVAPLALAPGAPQRRWLGLGIAQAAATALLVVGLLRVPLVALSSALGGPPSPEERLGQVYGAIGLFALGLAIVQAVTWVKVSVAALRAPREPSLAHELGRAAIVAALPAAVLAAIVHAVADALRLKGPPGLVLSPRLAAAGTAALLVVAVAAWLRLRLPLTPAAPDAAAPGAPAPPA